MFHKIKVVGHPRFSGIRDLCDLDRGHFRGHRRSFSFVYSKSGVLRHLKEKLHKIKVGHSRFSRIGDLNRGHSMRFSKNKSLGQNAPALRR